MFDLAGLRHAVADHGRVARVVIAAHDGSSPREVGAAMLVWGSGQSGTVGGGALEWEALARARLTSQFPGLVLPQAALRPRGPGYRIQLGVFGDAGNALKLYEQVAALGYEGHIQSRVMVGPFADRAAAEKARQALRRAGVGQGVLVPPEPSK